MKKNEKKDQKFPQNGKFCPCSKNANAPQGAPQTYKNCQSCTKSGNTDSIWERDMSYACLQAPMKLICHPTSHSQVSIWLLTPATLLRGVRTRWALSLHTQLEAPIAGHLDGNHHWLRSLHFCSCTNSVMLIKGCPRRAVDVTFLSLLFMLVFTCFIINPSCWLCRGK